MSKGVRKIDLKLLPAQFAFLRARTPQTLFLGGLGSGKTYVGAIKTILRSLEPQNSGVAGIIAATTYKQLKNATLATTFQVMEELGVRYRYKRNDQELWIENRPQPIHCYTLENYETIRGVPVAFAWLDEVARAKAEAFKVIVGRLRHPQGDNSVDLTTTPDGFNWVHDVFVEEPAQDARAAKVRSLVQASTYENYHLPESYFEQLEATFDDLLLRQELFAEFINIFGGRTYRTFERSRCEVEGDGAHPKRVLPLDLNIDFNVDPVIATVSQYRHTGTGPDEIVVCDEIALRNGDTPELCEEFVNRYPSWRTGVRIFGDATGHTRGATTGKSDYAVIRELLSRHFRIEFHVPLENPPVVDRVNAVNALFRERRQYRKDAVIGLLAKGKCPWLIRDLERVAFKRGTRVIDKSDPELTHASDGFGYMVHKLARIGRYTGPPARRVVAQYARR